MSSFKQAKRQAVPLKIALQGVSFSGKTMSGIKLAHGLAALRLAQMLDADPAEPDEVPMPGQVSRRALARACAVSCDTLARFERGIFAQLAELLDGSLTEEQAAALADLIDDPDRFTRL